MSDNVIEFPKPFDSSSLVEQMHGLQIELSENYKKIMENYMLSRALELESTNLQKRYDTILMRYAEIVGHENIPLGLIEYSNHIVSREDDEITMVEGGNLDGQLEELQANVRKTMDELATYLQEMTLGEQEVLEVI